MKNILTHVLGLKTHTEQLREACETGREEDVTKLIQAGADINARIFGTTALMVACKMGHKTVVQKLIKAGQMSTPVVVAQQTKQP